MKSRTLLVFYSRTGYTRRIASEISAACVCDVEELHDTVGRGGPLGYARSLLEAIARFDTLLAPAQHDPADYDLVVVGTPIWFWNLSSPVHTWARKHRGGLREVALFYTRGDSVRSPRDGRARGHRFASRPAAGADRSRYQRMTFLYKT